MSDGLQTLLGAGLVWITVFLTASIASGGLYVAFRALARFAPPASRGAVLMLYGLLPFLVATLVVCMLNFASLYSLLVPEHCHGAVCVPHPPEFAAPAAQAAVGAAATLLCLSTLFCLAAMQLQRRLRQSRLARRLAEPSSGYRVIDSGTPAAWCDGLWFPAVYVSRGLLDTVDANELQIVLAHEFAHARRRDNLARLSLDWATLLWPSAARRTLLKDFAASAEQACDAEAAELAGSRLFVSDLISRFETTAPAGVGAGGSLNDRVAELLESRVYADRSALAPWAVLLLLWLSSAYLFTRVAHPLLEWFSA